MGYYSFKCKSCHESIKAPDNLPKSMAWQNKVVVVIDENTRYEGSYDGYGTQHGVWHQRCFEEDCTLKGADYLLVDYNDLASESANDQGFWYERPDPKEDTLHRAFQRPDADGRVDTRLMSEIEAAESFEKPELEKDRGRWVQISPKSFWRHLRGHDWAWWDEREDEERMQRGADERVRLREYASHHQGVYWALFKAFADHWGYDNMQAAIHADWGGKNSTRERRARPSLPLEPQD